MRNYMGSINGILSNIDIQGGDENDYENAESILHELNNTGMSAESISGEVHKRVTESWHDANGFSISISPASRINC